MIFLLCYKDLKYEFKCTLVFCFGLLGSEYDSYEINVPVLLFGFWTKKKKKKDFFL